MKCGIGRKRTYATLENLYTYDCGTRPRGQPQKFEMNMLQKPLPMD